MATDILSVLERFYDAVPRPVADEHAVGPFSLFVARQGWPYYARPSLGASKVGPADVVAVLDEQRRLGVPRSLEWVHDTTPSLLAAARGAGMRVEEQPLLVLDGVVRETPVPGVTVSVVDPDDPRFSAVRAAVAAGFDGTDVMSTEPVQEWIAARVRDGLLRVVGAFAEQAPVGGGTHQTRGEVSELTGIATLPSWRRRGVGAAVTRALVDDAVAGGSSTVFLSAGDDAVARVYERVGFVRVATACVAEAD